MKHALETQKKADNIISAVINYKLIPAIKVILEDMGFEVGNAAFPMKRYTAEDKKKIIADVKSAGLEY